MASMVAPKLYKSGDIIMTCKPLVKVVVDDMKTKLCDYCLSFNSSLMSCGNCRQMFYCDQNCQQNDWAQHCLECDLFKANQNLTSSTIIIIRLWLMITNDGSIATKEYCLPSGHYISLNDIKINLNSEDLESLIDSTNHSSDLNSISIKEMAVFQFRLLVEKFDECKLDVDLKLLWKLFLQVWSNVLKIDVIDSDNDNNAYGLFVEASALSHSCEPNAAYVSYGHHLQIRAMRTIKPDEEITISYIDFAKPKSSREQLLKSYFIDCKCFKCQFNSDAKIDYEVFINLNNEFSQLIKHANDNYSKDLCSIADELVPFYESIYVDYYPDLSLFLVNYLKAMLMNMVRNNGRNISREFLKFVLSNVKISHGVDHKLYRKVAIIDSVTLLDLESNADEVIEKLKSKPTSRVKKYVFILAFLFLLFIIFNKLF